MTGDSKPRQGRADLAANKTKVRPIGKPADPMEKGLPVNPLTWTPSVLCLAWPSRLMPFRMCRHPRATYGFVANTGSCAGMPLAQKPSPGCWVNASRR